MKTRDFIEGGFYEEIEFNRIGKFIKWVSPTKVKIKLSHSTLTADWEGFQPIPLTEEWLLNFGFEKSGDYFIKTNSNFFFGITKDGQLMYLFDEEMTCPANINFVHTLQNLYHALTGKELNTPTNEILKKPLEQHREGTPGSH